MMKIRYTLEVTITMVSYNDSCYERHEDKNGNVNWFWSIGESLETLYEYDKLEEAFKIAKSF